MDGPRLVTSGCPVHGSIASAQPPRERMSVAMAIAHPQNTSNNRVFAASVSDVNVVSGVLVGWNVTMANVSTALFEDNGAASDARNGAVGMIARRSVRNVSGTRCIEYSKGFVYDDALDESRILMSTGCCTHVFDLICADKLVIDDNADGDDDGGDDNDMCNIDVVTSSDEIKFLSLKALVICQQIEYRLLSKTMRRSRAVAGASSLLHL